MLSAARTSPGRRGRYRTVVAAVAAATLLTACGGSEESSASAANGEELVPLDFQLNFLPGGTTLGYFVADYQGFYEEEGLEVDVRSSTDPTLSVRLIGSGERNIGAVYTADMLNAAVAGSPVTIVRSNQCENPFGILALAESGIEEPADLRGQRVGVTDLVVDRAYFAAMLESAGLTEQDLTVVNPGFTGVQQLLQGNLDATSEIVDYGPVIMEQQGKDYTFIPYADHGAPNAPFSAVAVNPDWLAEDGNEEIVQRFLRALDKAEAWASENLEEAADQFVAQFPDADKETVMAQFEASYDPGCSGASDIQEYQELADFLTEQGHLEEPVDVTEHVTNDYLAEPVD
ncbi:ABC transporter substrate-binding protein [Geodermatophilus sp. DF01-2]|uniref:ABC transporter substrate-binding protein n=1 Tax=Geodermatophilus sp. DF01-2 TaxID=2559610 RepID=UPI001073B551|nr:ABC transporter substrate-binding protein [Geodermatophilus sp. DF01_2]TFV59828.1 ABC transporter substrate-binding protein [Geodermatophilus sp. DF01_2]